MSVNDFQKTNMVSLASAARPKIEGEKDSLAKRIFPALTLGVFFLALLLALASGAMVYKAISDSTTANNAERTGAGLICNAIHANDAKGAIAIRSGAEGRSLVIEEILNTGTYETRFYLHDGKVLQEYSLATSPYSPDKATVVTTSNTFNFTYSHGLLTVTTDQGTAEVAIRSVSGGEANA